MIGVLLHQAGLLHPGQIQVVVMEQSVYEGLKFGEIIALHGWLKQETIDFFVKEWHSLLINQPNEPIGYFFVKAHLLTEDQVNQILQEQWQTGYRFGAVAVLNGWLKQETVDFFLNHLAPQVAKQSVRIEKRTITPGKTSQPGVKTTLEQKHQATYVQGGTVMQMDTHIQNYDPEDLADMDKVEVDWLG
ncbi:hypothetical protein [Synechococcus sp. PCC 6312]|uniref:hypothetical protein n=1 Tax=Synechococcus sp. (strain ATCC 27167 / PCC 6312) TaxID=195253 RepID=UPI00029F030B|nr:hypothetical protein [Synechococcus sp. PCC 6312]AFY59659.1 hypothetical protein Syn6312_0430 [Synechococcus sp. PCC 6312]